MIQIRRYVSNLLLSNMYVIAEGGHAVVIDPFADTAPGQGLTIDRILLTHEHYDHISGVTVWKATAGAPVLCSKACAQNIQNPKMNLARHFKEFCELQTWVELEEIPPSDPEYVCSAEEVFENTMTLPWRGHVFDLFEIPGHSQGSIGILLDGSDFFPGDSLMEHNDIELRMPGGSRRGWKEIGSGRVDAIPKGTRVWPGHFEGFIK